VSVKLHRSIGPALLLAAALSAPAAAGAADPPKGFGAKASSAAATPPAPPTGTVDERASKWLSMGNKAFKDGKFAEAEKAYHEAFVLKQVYDIAGNLAMAEFAQSKHRDAAEHLALAIRLFPVTGEPSTREQMQKTFDQCKGKVGAVKVVVSTARGAQVSVDGKTVGEAPLADDVYLEPGKHTISVTAKGYKDASKDVEVKKGAEETVKLDLVLLPPEVVVRNMPDKPPPPRSKKPAIVMGSVAVLAAGVGAAMMVVSGSKKTSAIDLSKHFPANERPCSVDETKNPTNGACNELLGTASAVDTFHDAAIGLFVGAGVVGAAAVVYLLLPPPAAKKAPVQGLRATPLFGSGQAGFLLSGAF
jgi:PEGA domain